MINILIKYQKMIKVSLICYFEIIYICFLLYVFLEDDLKLDGFSEFKKDIKNNDRNN